MFTVILDANNKVIHDPSQNDSGLLVVGGVINKQVNCADSFTFTIYPDNVGYSDIEIMTTWLSVLKDGEVVFHGRVLAEKTGWNNEKEITCEGDLAILNDSILRPYSFSGTLSDYMTMLINQHNAQVGADKQIVIKTVDNPTTQIIRRTADYKPTLQELFEKIVNYFGGYLVIEIENGVRKISYVTDSTSGTNQTLEIGKNIIDFNRTIAAEALATAIIPLGATSEETGQRLTIKTVNDGSDFLASPDAATKGLIYAVYTFDGITDPAELKAKGQAVLEDLTRIVPRIELSAVDLSSAGYDIDAIGFFQYVTVQDNAHTVSGQYLITERTYNISAPEQDKVTFGGQEKTISGQSAKTQIDLSSVEDNVINKAVDIVQYQTDLLKGASGGFFVIGTNSQGKPSETFWMDTDSTATARKVLRINFNGIGFSANGISGPYDSAWTLNGAFNANFIRVGTLNCDLITVTNLDGSSIKANTLELNKFSNAAQAAIVSNAQTQQEYYLSTSDASATGGSWSTTIPTWTPGKYIWTRTKNTVTNSAGTSSSSYIPSAAGQYDSALTTALSTADAASGTAGGALVSSVPLYYRSTSSTAPAKPVAEISNAGTGSDVWTLAMPAPLNGCYFFTCNQFKTANGTASWSDVREISSATYASKWCASADSTYIDGGQIYTGSITADKIKAGEVFAQKLYAHDFNITGGSINITTSSETYDVISFQNNEWHNAFSPLELRTWNTTTKNAMLLQAGGLYTYENYGTASQRQRAYIGNYNIFLGNVSISSSYQNDVPTIRLRNATDAAASYTIEDANRSRVWLDMVNGLRLWNASGSLETKLSPGDFYLNDTNGAQRFRAYAVTGGGRIELKDASNTRVAVYGDTGGLWLQKAADSNTSVFITDTSDVTRARLSYDALKFFDSSANLTAHYPSNGLNMLVGHKSVDNNPYVGRVINLGVVFASEMGISSSASASVVAGGWLSFCCDKYPNAKQCVFEGVALANSYRMMRVMIYDTSDKSGIQPNVASGTMQFYNGDIVVFGANNYNVWTRNVTMSAQVYP